MCAIVGSLNPNKFLELIDLNSYRGQHSYSFAVYDTHNGSLSNVTKALGKFNKEAFLKVTDESNTRLYYIGHIQAPTTSAQSTNSIHPAIDTSTATHLWHNGVIKAGKFGDFIWDTQYLLEAYLDDRLSNVDGQFSCLAWNRTRLEMFRNEIAPMFIDRDLNISSTKFEGASETKPNTIFELDFHEMNIFPEGSFTTKETPYFFGN